MAYAQAGILGQQGVANAQTQPKELGALQRVDGLRNGLKMLRSRLESFSDRLDGNGSEAAEKDIAPVSASLSGTLSEAEAELRICLQMLLYNLHDRF